MSDSKDADPVWDQLTQLFDKAINGTLKAVTNGTTTNDNATVSSAVAEIIDVSKKAYAESRLEAVVWEMWYVFLKLAENTPPDRQGALVEFLLELRKHTINNKEGKPVTIYGLEVWDDLPIFRMEAREDFRNQHTTAEKVNYHAFFARLSALDDALDDDLLDFPIFGLWALRDAFEEINRDEPDRDASLRTAAAWIEYGGKRLKEISEEGWDLNERVGAPGDKLVDQEWKGFNETRWGVWKKGFEQAAAEEGVSDELKGLLKKVVELM